MTTFHRWIELLHLYAGLLAAPLLFALGLTGSFLVFEYPIDHLLNHQLAYVQIGAGKRPLSVLLENIRREYPSASVLTFALSPSSPAPDLAYTAQIQLPNLQTPSTVYVDQYTGNVLGKKDGLSFATSVHEFHTDLLVGESGALVVMMTAGLLILISASGLVLWWPRKILNVRWTASGKRVTFDLHNTVGFYSFLFMLLFGVTAVVIHWQSRWLPMTNHALHLSDNEPDFRVTAPQAGSKLVMLDAVAERAWEAVPGARLTQINMPGNRGIYRAWLKFPEDGTPLGRSFVLVNAYSGGVLYARSARSVHVPTRFFREWNRELHTGDVLGLPTRILACVMSLALPLLAVTGPLFWWRKRRTFANRKAALKVAA